MSLDILRIDKFISSGLLDIFEKANNPKDNHELFVLYLGSLCLNNKSEFEIECYKYYIQQRNKRVLKPQDIIDNFDLVGFIKKIYNYFFRNDLYGINRNDNNLIMSSGSLDEDVYPIPSSLKFIIKYAVDKNWYGYSDSLGLESCRRAICDYENSKANSDCYNVENIAITLGATQSVSSIVDMITGTSDFHSEASAIIAAPNYPPLAESINKKVKSAVIPIEENGSFDLSILKNRINKDTRFILLQTVLNPSGLKITDKQLIDLIEHIPNECFLILDECHDCYSELNPSFPFPITKSNVIRVNSASKLISAPGLKMGWIIADKSIINSMYEYASTTYGSPNSIFYSFLEFLTRFETFKMEGHKEIEHSLASMFSPIYPFGKDKINELYQSYLIESRDRIGKLIGQRECILSFLEERSFNTIQATHSINTCLDISFTNKNSYEFYRNTLHKYKMSLFPGILNFRLGDNDARLTVSQNSKNISEAKFILNKISTEYL